ncbi:MAG: hypothetical protein LBN23_05985 [Paludibacter sp.]|nr:hypothetical protein [Paludibacter sp.]
MLLFFAALFFSHSAQAATPAYDAYPFNGAEFTDYGATADYVEFRIPIYDDTDNDRYLVGSGTFTSLEYSINGTSWNKLLEFQVGNQGEADWYWVKVRKSDVSPSPTVVCYANRPGTNHTISTAWSSQIECYRSNRNAKSPTFMHVKINNSSLFQDKPVAFRLQARWSQNSASDYSATWYLHSKQNPYTVWRAGYSMHAPTINSYTIVGRTYYRCGNYQQL